MEYDDGFRKRMRTIVTQAGGQVPLAAAAGVSKSAISKYSRGESQPNRQRLMQIARAAQVDPAWLMYGQQQQSIQISSGSSSFSGVSLQAIHTDSLQLKTIKRPAFDESSGNIYLLPFYENNLEQHIKNMNAPIEDRLQKRDTPYPASPYFVHRILDTRHVSDLAVFVISGDNMEPTLRAQDIVIADMAKRHIGNGLIVIAENHSIQIRRIRRPIGKPIELHCDNSERYPVEYIETDKFQELDIIGRVIWHGRRM